LTKNDFSFEPQTEVDEFTDIEDVGDDMVPKLGKFENKKAKYLKNLKSERFKEPRMFTME
jgi:hypothetical protein